MLTTSYESRQAGTGAERKPAAKKRLVRRALTMFLAWLTVIGIGGLTPMLKGISAGALEKPVEIKQVLPIENGIVAVVYTDGTVKVSENARFSDAVSDWTDVEQIYYNRQKQYEDGEFYDVSSLIGRTKTGTILSTEEDFPVWSNVKEVFVYPCGVVALTHQGTLLAHGDWEDDSFLTGQTNVKTLIYNVIQDRWGCLKKNGGAYALQENNDPELLWWNVKELRDSGHAFYAIQRNGAVVGEFDFSYANLRNAVKVVLCSDLAFGISADGRLLTHDGGNLYTNFGWWVVDEPGVDYYSGEVDVSQYTQIVDIEPCWGLILTKRDGTIDSISEDPKWDLQEWHDIVTVCGYRAVDDDMVIMGLKKDGSVIVNRAERNQDETYSQTIIDQYCGWELKAIYEGDEGVVGLTTDGHLVGDGIYETVDFSMFDR